MVDEHLTRRQEQWFASVREGLVRDTGKSLDEWVAVARSCPETRPRARLQWMKDNHGLGQNRATVVFDAAFPSSLGWKDAAQLRLALWKDPASLSILAGLQKVVASLPDTVETQRKGFTAWSKRFQFAAARPLRSGQAVLGLAVSATADLRLSPAAGDGWSERLKARVVLTSSKEVDAALGALLRQAWADS